jgi:diadenosine tetraphosphate (Ap4A) HIT family hydrolase
MRSTRRRIVPNSQCCFCAELAGERTAFHDLYRDLDSRVIVGGPNFVVMPSLGQLAPGHTLVLPRRHVTSFGELGEQLRREASALFETLRLALSEHFSPVVCFEHGSQPGATAGGCGIVHAHVHIVPIDGREARLPPSVGGGWREVSGNHWLDEAASLVRQGVGYLMWHDPSGGQHLEAAGDVPSQHLRRYVAGLLGEIVWDWRTAGRQDALADMLVGNTREALAVTAQGS